MNATAAKAAETKRWEAEQRGKAVSAQIVSLAKKLTHTLRVGVISRVFFPSMGSGNRPKN